MNELTLTERMILANQYRILGLLDPSAADHYDLNEKIVTRGYTKSYWQLENDIEKEPMSEATGEFVYEILEMYRAIFDSNQALPSAAQLDAGVVSFRGFDGNHESELKSYATFLLNDCDLYRELHNADHSYNSHAPMWPRYEAMTLHWQSLGKPPRLTAQELQDLLDAS